MRSSHVLAVVIVPLLALPLGCASTSPDAAVADSGAADASRDFQGDFRPIDADSATIVVRGLSCPKCAYNVNLQLEKIDGVGETHIDMGSGEVKVNFSPLAARHPSRAQLAQAITDAGFTVLDIKTP